MMNKLNQKIDFNSVSSNNNLVPNLPIEKNNRNLLFLILLLILFTFFGLFVYQQQFFLKIDKTKLPNRYVLPTSTISIAKQDILNKNIFVKEVPNFDTLSLKDLPNFGDIRGIYKYQNNYIIVGFGRVIIYDPITKQIIKQNGELNCLHSAALVNQYLFISCNSKRWIGNYPQGTFAPSILYKVNLSSGEIEKTYFGENQREHSLINISLIANENFLWGSSDDEIFKLDVLKDEFKFYRRSDLGFPSKCVIGGIYREELVIKIFTWDSPYCTGGSIYDEKVDKWQYHPTSSDRKFLSKSTRNENLEKELTILNIKIPYYLAVSNKINEKYYLFTRNEIYTLQRSEFPKFFVKTNADLSRAQYQAFITKDEQYALLMRSASGPGMTKASEILPIFIFDFQKGIATNIMEDVNNSARFNSISWEKRWKITSTIMSGIVSYNEAQDKIEIVDNKSKEKLFIVDIVNNILIF